MAEPQQDEMREFMWTLRRALYLVLRWIERRYNWPASTPGNE